VPSIVPEAAKAPLLPPPCPLVKYQAAAAMMAITNTMGTILLGLGCILTSDF
jgi:hypothetical protein